MKVITQKPIEFQSSASGLVNYVATEGNQNIGANYDEFSPEDDFLSNIDGEDLESEFSNAIGDARRARRARKNSKRKSKDEARILKAQAKLEEQKAKTTMAKEGAKGDIAMAKALATPAPTKGSKKPMSKGVKIGIAVGIVALVVGVGLVVYKMKKRK